VGLLAEISTSDQGVARVCVVCDGERRHEDIAVTGDLGASSPALFHKITSSADEDNAMTRTSYLGGELSVSQVEAMLSSPGVVTNTAVGWGHS
jgi:hypothetical protein